MTHAAASGAAGITGLRPPAHRVDPRARTWWTAQAALTAVVAVGGVAVVLALTVDPALGLGLDVLVALLGIAYVVVMPRWRYAVHRWESTEQALHTAAGWWWQEERVAPLARIQTVDTARGPLQQLFGLASVVATTASASGPLRIAGLDHQQAQEVVDHLVAVTSAVRPDEDDGT